MVWVSDITFINTAKGHVYLCVIIDLFARKVIAWAVSSSLSAKFAADLLLRAWKIRKKQVCNFSLRQGKPIYFELISPVA